MTCSDRLRKVCLNVRLSDIFGVDGFNDTERAKASAAADITHLGLQRPRKGPFFVSLMQSLLRSQTNLMSDMRQSGWPTFLPLGLGRPVWPHSGRPLSCPQSSAQDLQCGRRQC
eukprot:scaffold366921_cov43-Prasinocladus_malaysianus.AAC.1